MRKFSPLLASSVMMTGLTVAIAIILLASNFTIINAQPQQLTSQPGEIEDRGIAAATATTTAAGRTFQSANDSFSIQVPDGWIISDFNNTGFTSPEELRQGYVMLAQLCPEEQQQQQRILSNVGGSTNSSSSSSISTGNDCQRAKEVIHIIRYPDLDTRLLTNNITTSNNNMMTTTDNILSYHLQKLQQVGYRNIEIVNSIERTVNITNAQTEQTIQTVPAKFVEMTYSTASAPNEIREGYFMLTATNATAPNLGMTKGYSVFYEGGSSITAGRTTTAPEITTASSSLIPSLTPSVGQVFDSFELIAAPGVEQPTAQQTQATEATITTEDEEDNVGDGDDEEDDIDDEEDDDDDVGDDDSNDEDNSCHPSYPDVCIPPPPPNLNCDDIDARNFEVSGSDPHGFDGDNDGIGCESGSNDSDNDEDNGADDDEDGNEGGSEEGQPPGGELSPGISPPEGEGSQPPETGEEGGQQQPPGGELSPGTPSPTNDNGEETISPPEEGQGSEEGGQQQPPGGELSPGTPSPTNDNGEETISPPEEGQGSENEFEDCIVPPGMNPGDVGC